VYLCSLLLLLVFSSGDQFALSIYFSLCLSSSLSKTHWEGCVYIYIYIYYVDCQSDIRVIPKQRAENWCHCAAGGETMMRLCTPWWVISRPWEVIASWTVWRWWLCYKYINCQVYFSTTLKVNYWGYWVTLWPEQRVYIDIFIIIQ